MYYEIDATNKIAVDEVKVQVGLWKNRFKLTNQLPKGTILFLVMEGCTYPVSYQHKNFMKHLTKRKRSRMMYISIFKVEKVLDFEALKNTLIERSKQHPTAWYMPAALARAKIDVENG